MKSISVSPMKTSDRASRMPFKLRSEAMAFFDKFVAAFQKFDGALIGSRYVAPYVAMHTDGLGSLCHD